MKSLLLSRFCRASSLGLEGDCQAEPAASSVGSCPIIFAPLGTAELGAGLGTVSGLKNSLFFPGNMTASSELKVGRGRELAGCCKCLHRLKQCPLT